MSKQDLADKLTRMSHFTNPPADVVADVLAAYEARVAELNAALDHEWNRVAAEVDFQHTIREQERQIRAEQQDRHQAEKRHLIQELGMAAKVYSRVLNAKREGRKMVRVDSLVAP